MKRIYIVFFIVLAITSCSKKSSSADSSDTRDSLECEWNESEMYALCVTETVDPKSNTSAKKYKVLDTDNKMVYEGVIDNGNVLWLDDEAVEIIQIPGNLPADADKEDFSKVYVISSNEIVTKKEYLKMTGQLKSDDNGLVQNDLEPDACLVDVRVISIADLVATIEIVDVKVCRTVSKEPKVGELYKIDLSEKKLIAEKNYTLKVSIPTESRGNKLFLLEVLK